MNNKQSKQFPIITRPDGYKVESWYDRHIRSWTTILKDTQGNQVGDAQFDAGSHEGLKISRKMLKTVEIKKYAPNYTRI